MELMMNGIGIMKLENGEYYIEDETWGCYKGCSRNEFIDALRNISWVCLTTWDKELRQQYLDMVDYVNNIGR